MLAWSALALMLSFDAACSETGTWSMIPSSAAPSPRKWTGAVFDPVRDRLIVIGGLPGPQGDVWVQSLTGTPQWTQLHPAGVGPSARFAHSTIYQPGQDRVILFGGFDVAFRNDVWALSLAGTPAWTVLTPTGTPPPARWAHVAIYDAARNRMVVFGGYDGSVSRNDVWALTLDATPAWTQITPAGPLPEARTNVAGVYDTAGDRLVVFGGFNTTSRQFLNTTWVLPLAPGGVWTLLNPRSSLPTRRRDHSMVYAAGKVILFGGEFAGPLNDTQILTLSPTPAWTQVVPTGTLPAPRAAHRAIYDTPHDRMVIFGGDLGGAYLNETWALALDSPTPALVSLAAARAEPGVARVTWQVSGGEGATITAWRRTEATGWTAMGELVPDGQQRVTFEDRAIAEGARYGYRLGIHEGERETYAGEVWLDIPRAARLSLAGAYPNPSGRTLAIRYSLEDASPATLELFDTSGRSMLRREVGSEGAGAHVFRVAGAGLWPAGLYVARLSQHRQALTSRVAIIR